MALIVTIALNQQRAHEASAVAAQGLTAATPEIAANAAVMGFQDAYVAVFILLLVPFLLAFTIDDRKAERALARRQRPVVEVEEAAGGGS